MNATIFIKKSPELNQILFQTSNIDEIKQYLSENQSDDLFIRIEDNQYVDVFSGKNIEKYKIPSNNKIIKIIKNIFSLTAYVDY